MFRCHGVALAILFVCSTTYAQDLEGARVTFEEAERQFHLENYQLALEGFLRTHELLEGDPARQAILQFNIGRALEELGRDAEAARAYRQFLQDAPEGVEHRDETRERVRELEARVRSRESESLHEERSDHSGWMLAGGSLAAVGIVTALGAIVPGTMALDGAATLEEQCPGGECGADSGGLIDEVRTLSLVTDGLWIAGSGVALLGATLLIAGVSMDGDSREGAAMACSRQLCWFDVHGTF